jgi:hypothetical protein
MTGQLLTLPAQIDYESGEIDPLRMIGGFVVAALIYFGVPFVGYNLYRMAKDSAARFSH